MCKIYVDTAGCTANQADSEVLKGLLKRAGYDLSDLESAELVIFNTCSLKAPSEDSLFRKIKDAREQGKKIVVAGCFPLSFPDDERLEKYSLMGSFDFKRVVEVVEETLKGEQVVFLSRGKEEKLCLPRVRDNKKIAKITIGKGCLNFCSYCAGRLARGELISFNIEKIISSVKQAIKDGCNWIYLTCQDCGCWGVDKGTNIVELLKRVLDLEGSFKVRIGMMSPQWVLTLLPELVEIYKHKKVKNFLHIPVQSGSNKILEKMNRKYTVEQFRKIVTSFREEIPNIYISTDIIVGFPGETEADFKKTVELIDWLKPDFLNLTKYWSRKGTVAAGMEQVPMKIRNRRSKIVHNTFRKIKNKK